MTLLKQPQRPAAPQTPVWMLILGAVSLLIIGVVIGVLLPIAPPGQQQTRPAQESLWRLSNICIASYGLEYANRLDSAQLALACNDMAQQYAAAHPALVETCLSHIWDIDAALCIDDSGQHFDTAPLEAP